MPNKSYIQNDKGVYRHAASGNIVPPEVLREHGYLPSDVHLDAYDDEMAKAIDNYRKAQENMTDEQKAERAFELRAVHGPGVEIVNALTGERFTT